MKRKTLVLTLMSGESIDAVELAMLVRIYSHELRKCRFRVVAKDSIRAELKKLGILELIEK